jgi:hypothetical protein
MEDNPITWDIMINNLPNVADMVNNKLILTCSRILEDTTKITTMERATKAKATTAIISETARICPKPNTSKEEINSVGFKELLHLTLTQPSRDGVMEVFEKTDLSGSHCN